LELEFGIQIQATRILTTRILRVLHALLQRKARRRKTKTEGSFLPDSK
jgi:hypothetical protein